MRPQDLSYDLWDEAAIKAAAEAPYLAVSGIFEGLAPFVSLEGLAVVAGPDVEGRLRAQRQRGLPRAAEPA